MFSYRRVACTSKFWRQNALACHDSICMPEMFKIPMRKGFTRIRVGTPSPARYTHKPDSQVRRALPTFDDMLNTISSQKESLQRIELYGVAFGSPDDDSIRRRQCLWLFDALNQCDRLTSLMIDFGNDEQDSSLGLLDQFFQLEEGNPTFFPRLKSLEIHNLNSMCFFDLAKLCDKLEELILPHCIFDRYKMPGHRSDLLYLSHLKHLKTICVSYESHADAFNRLDRQVDNVDAIAGLVKMWKDSLCVPLSQIEIMYSGVLSEGYQSLLSLAASNGWGVTVMQYLVDQGISPIAKHPLSNPPIASFCLAYDASFEGRRRVRDYHFLKARKPTAPPSTTRLGADAEDRSWTAKRSAEEAADEGRDRTKSKRRQSPNSDLPPNQKSQATVKPSTRASPASSVTSQVKPPNPFSEGSGPTTPFVSSVAPLSAAFAPSTLIPILSNPFSNLSVEGQKSSSASPFAAASSGSAIPNPFASPSQMPFAARVTSVPNPFASVLIQATLNNATPPGSSVSLGAAPTNSFATPLASQSSTTQLSAFKAPESSASHASTSTTSLGSASMENTSIASETPVVEFSFFRDKADRPLLREIQKYGQSLRDAKSREHDAPMESDVPQNQAIEDWLAEKQAIEDWLESLTFLLGCGADVLQPSVLYKATPFALCGYLPKIRASVNIL
jgi:hypothetical protein